MWKKKETKANKKLLSEENILGPDEEFESAEEKEEEIDESLAEIYEDENGAVVDVKKFDIKKDRGAIFWTTVLILSLVVAGALGWFYYDYRSFNQAGNDHFKLEIQPAEDKVIAGEETEIKIAYKNLEKVDIKNLNLRVIFPDNFIVTSAFPESVPASSTKNILWQTGSLGPNGSGELRIKGRVLAPAGSLSTIYAEAAYTPVNFSSEFKKTSTFDLSVKDIGVDFNFDNFTSALAGEENQINVKFKKQEESYLNNFIASLEAKNNNLEVVPVKYEGLNWIQTSTSSPNELRISEVVNEDREFPLKFKITEKRADSDSFKIIISAENEGIKYPILEKEFNFEVIKGALTLSLIINGSKNDQGISLGDNLSYLLSYANKGETELKDVIIMAVIEGEAIDWASLKDGNSGKVSGNTISWSKNEISGLAALTAGSEGNIEFSVKVKDHLSNKTSAEIKSYAKFTLSGAQDGKDNSSNTIVNKINSQIVLSEKIQYFNDDNIPVGLGPIPPKAGETTAYKVSWAVGGNIHELSGAKVEMPLPDGVSYAGKNYSGVGQIQYDSNENKVTWTIGRLPILSEDLTAEFSISVTPKESDRNKIMVLSSGSRASGLNTETNSTIESQAKAKTTRLEDDEIGASDGVVK